MKWIRSDSQKTNLFIAIGYNCLIVAYEIISRDKTGQGLIAIACFLILATLLHGIILFIKNLKQSFKAALFSALFITGLNTLLFFVDIFLVILIFNLLSKFGFIH